MCVVSMCQCEDLLVLVLAFVLTFVSVSEEVLLLMAAGGQRVRCLLKESSCGGSSSSCLQRKERT